MVGDRWSGRTWHSHKCPQCALVFSHSNDCHGDEKKHTCPNCGAKSWIKYDPNERKLKDSIEDYCLSYVMESIAYNSDPEETIADAVQTLMDFIDSQLRGPNA